MKVEVEIINNGQSRLVAVSHGDSALIDHVRVDSLSSHTGDDGIKRANAKWVEVLFWDYLEWQTSENKAFEAILGVIQMIDAGEKVKKP